MVLEPDDKMDQCKHRTVSVVIPTYQREQVLVSTIQQLIDLSSKPTEIIIVDQTLQHLPEVERQLSQWHEQNCIKRYRKPKPSIPEAMNLGLLKANSEIVLFLDDDVKITTELVRIHAQAYDTRKLDAVAGRVIQSWQSPLTKKQGSYANGNSEDPDGFLFHSAHETDVRRFIGCNVSFDRRKLLDVGGFDENFVKVAYRFEAEAADRFVSAGNIIRFIPEASLNHLKVSEGGTRSFGEHFKTMLPGHSVGRYYYYLVVKNQKNRWLNLIKSPFMSVVTKFHLSNPWWIPITFIAESAGLIWALGLRLSGQKLIQKE